MVKSRGCVFLSLILLIQLNGPALLPSVLPICGVRNLLYHYLLAEMFVPDRSIKRVIRPQSLLRLGGVMASTMEMRSTKMLMELEALAEKLGIQVVYERLPRSRSGLCRLYDKYMLFVERNLDEDEQVSIFVEALSRFHIDNIQMLPRIRHILQEYNLAI